MINFFSLFFAYILIFFSISGYGSTLIENKTSNKVNIFENYLYGLPIITIISFFYSNLLQYNKYINIFFAIIGLLFFLKNKCFNKNIFIIILFFTGVIIGQKHDDFNYYHYQNLKEIVENGPTLGLGNLATRYIYSSIFTYVQAIYYLPFYELNLFHVPLHLTYVSLIGYLLIEFFFKKKLEYSWLLLIAVIIIYIIKFSRLSEHGYDYLSQFIITYIFLKNFVLKKISFFEINYFYIFSILLKVSTIFYLPLYIYLLFNSLNKEKILKNKNQIIILIFLISIFFINSFIKSGCLSYTNKILCQNEKIEWNVPYNKIEQEKKFVEIWAKAHHHGGEKNGIKIDDYNILNFSWVKYWFKAHFLGKITDYIFVIFLTFLIVIFLTSKIKFLINFKKNIFLKILVISSLFIWLQLIPGMRFFLFGIVLILYLFFIDQFLEIKKFSKSKIYILIIISIFYFNYSNLLRINKEIKENKFLNFPYFNLPVRNVDKIYSDNNNFYYITIDMINEGSGYCFNSPTPCKENLDGGKNKQININKYLFFKVFSLNKN